jgi:dihydrodipicolinate synthase/N-acetylneuraminate lyase
VLSPREVPNIRSIKDTSADLAQAGQLIHSLGDVISTFVGWDSLMLAALTEGATGVMAGTANVMPAQLVSVSQAVTDGDLGRARAEWAQLYPLMDATVNAPCVAAIKSVLDTLAVPSWRSTRTGARARRGHGGADRRPGPHPARADGCAIVMGREDGRPRGIVAAGA